MQAHVNNFLRASERAVQNLNLLAYPGQDPNLRRYKAGYEMYMDQLPELRDNDPLLPEKIKFTEAVLLKLARELRTQSWLKGDNVSDNMSPFIRTIIAMEEPEIKRECMGYPGSGITKVTKEGAELVVAKWADGYSSPVHGHAPGYIHENIIFGRMRVNRYRMVSPTSNVVRPVRTDIEGAGLFASIYAKENPGHVFRRQTLIHNFTAVGFSASLHFLPEHTRDGRDNSFEVEYFEQEELLTERHFSQTDSKTAMYAQKGEVFLVRSTNVPEYGDHWIVITGPPVVKEHGSRPQDVAIYAPSASRILDKYEMKTGLILLRLRTDMQAKFREFHGIEMVGGEVVFPDPDKEAL